MQQEKIAQLTSELDEEKYAHAKNLDIFLSSVLTMPVHDWQAVFKSLETRGIIAPLWKGYPSTLNCLRKALRYVE